MIHYHHVLKLIMTDAGRHNIGHLGQVTLPPERCQADRCQADRSVCPDTARGCLWDGSAVDWGQLVMRCCPLLEPSVPPVSCGVLDS